MTELTWELNFWIQTYVSCYMKEFAIALILILRQNLKEMLVQFLKNKKNLPAKKTHSLQFHLKNFSCFFSFSQISNYHKKLYLDDNKKTNKKEYKETKIIDNQNLILLVMLALIPDAWYTIKNSLCKKLLKSNEGLTN